MTDPQAIAARLSEARHADRVLDAEIYAQICQRPHYVAHAYASPNGRGRVVRRFTDGTTSWCKAPEYTGSIDAALRLVPAECWVVCLTEDRAGGWFAKLAVREPHKSLPAAHAPTPALAMCLAAVRSILGESNG